jgi:hypothetical protein
MTFSRKRKGEFQLNEGDSPKIDITFNEDYVSSFFYIIPHNETIKIPDSFIKN